MIISNSEIAAWTRCPRKWFVTYYLGYQVADPPPVGSAQLGTKVHLAMEARYGYGIEADLAIRVLYAAEIHDHPGWETELIAEQDLALAMVTGYEEWLDESGADAVLELIATEHTVSVPLPSMPEVSLKCRLDQVFRNGDTLLFNDYKTGQNFERAEALALDPQMKIYQVAQHLTVKDEHPELAVAGGMMTTLRRVKRTGRAEPPFYRRDQFRYGPGQVRATYLRIVSVARDIMDARAKLDAVYARGGSLAEVNELQLDLLRPTPIPDRCKWECPLANGVCVSMDDGSDWAGILTSSGRFEQADPYGHYQDTAIKTIQDQIAKIEAS